MAQQEVVPLRLMEPPLAEVGDKESYKQVAIELDVAEVVGPDEIGAHGRVEEATQVGKEGVKLRVGEGAEEGNEREK